MSWTRTLKTTTHTFIFHKKSLLTNQTNQGRSQQPIGPSARCTIFPPTTIMDKSLGTLLHF